MSGSGIVLHSSSLGSPRSTRVRTGASFKSAILVTRELISLPSMFVRTSDVFMAVASRGEEIVLLAQTAYRGQDSSSRRGERVSAALRPDRDSRRRHNHVSGAGRP